MSVKTNQKLKGFLFMLIITISTVNSLLIKQTPKVRTLKTKAVHIDTPKRRNAHTGHTIKIKSKKERRLSLNLEKKQFKSRSYHKQSAKGHKLARKLVPSKNIHKSSSQSRPKQKISESHQELNDNKKLATRSLKSNDSGALMSLVLIAAIVFIIAQAPMWGVMIFAMPIFLEMITSILGTNCGRSLKAIKPQVRLLKKNKDNKFNKQMIAEEERKIVLYMHSHHFSVGPETTEPELYNITSKYLKDVYHVKEKGFRKELKRILHTLYKNTDKIMGKIKEAL